MKKLLLALGLCLLPSLAFGQCSGVFTAGNVCGAIITGPPKQIPITSFPPFASASANTVFAGPTTGAAAAPAFRALVGADLPNPSSTTLGGIRSYVAVANQWINAISTAGIPSSTQPSFADLSGQATLAQLPSIAADTVLGRWASGTGVPSATAMPDCTGALNYSTTTHTFSCNTASIPNAPDQVSNCSLAATVAANALTISLKDQTGADPSALSPCSVSFRSATPATGTYTTVSVTSALSFSTGTTGSTFGTTNNVSFRLWITAWNNAGTLVLGVSRQSASPIVYPINEGIVQSSTACSACTNASSAGVYYTTAAQTSKAIRILGYMDWDAGLATAGVWASGPTQIQMFGSGIKRPGEIIQTVVTPIGTFATGTTLIPVDNTIPQITEGDEYITRAITPQAKPNLLRVTAQAMLSNSNVTRYLTAALFQDATAGALAANSIQQATAQTTVSVAISYWMQASTISSTTFRIRAGADSAGTTTFNGSNSGQLYGGVANSYLQVDEIQS